MQTLTIDNALFEQISKVATQEKTTPNDIAIEAFRLYLWERQQREVSAEAKRYRQQHDDLKNKYLGLFIAMHNGRVVDSANEFSPLHKRIRQQFGNTGVFITQVDHEPIQTLSRRI